MWCVYVVKISSPSHLLLCDSPTAIRQLSPSRVHGRLHAEAYTLAHHRHTSHHLQNRCLGTGALQPQRDAGQEDLLRARLLAYSSQHNCGISRWHTFEAPRASFLCVTETESMATVCPSAHSPASGGHLHASDKSDACPTHSRYRARLCGVLASGGEEGV